MADPPQDVSVTAPMPPILYGTAWKKDRTASFVALALRTGFRGIDTACQPKHYDEGGVGAGIVDALGADLRREDLYLQTKFTPFAGQDPNRIPYDPAAPLEEQVRVSCETSLANLRTSYLDGLVLHSPLRTLDLTLRAWRAMEDCVERGWARSLGISNCYEPSTLETLYDRARIKPTVLQNRFYDRTGYDKELRALCRDRSIRYQSFWTLTANPGVLRDRVLGELSARYGMTREQVFLRALTEQGIVPLVGTTSTKHMADDLAMFDVTLSDAEVGSVMGLVGG